MSVLTKQKVKYILAGLGAVYLVLFVGYLVYAGVKAAEPGGPSELEAHPELQDQILAERRAQEMQDRLDLTDEQARQVAEVFAEGAGEGGFRERGRAIQEALAKILTPEQQQKLREGGGPGGWRGGPPRFLTPERIESLQQKMTPEQQARFAKAMDRMQQRMRQFGGRGGGRGGQDGPEGPGGPSGFGGPPPGGFGGPPPGGLDGPPPDDAGAPGAQAPR